MQWLIDIILEMIRAVGMFVNRGDPNLAELTIINIIPDGNWHDFDISGIIDKDAHAVLLSYWIINTNINRWIQFRPKSNVNDFNMSRIQTEVANVGISGDLVVPLDENHELQYKSVLTNWAFVRITVKGWWF